MAFFGAWAASWLNPEPWVWRAELAWSEPWRNLSAAWIHLSGWHLALNLAGAALLAVLGTSAGCDRRAAQAWLLAWPLTHLALTLQPALSRYGGLSGVLHAGVAVIAWQLLRGEQGRRRAVGAALAAGLVLKLLLEAPWMGPLRHVPGWDFAIAPLAHSTGAVAGWLGAAVCGVGNPAPRESQAAKAAAR